MTDTNQFRAPAAARSTSRRNLFAWGACLVTVAVSSLASAQLEPQRMYYGIDRKVPMTVQIPAGAEGEAKIQLLQPVTASVNAEATVTAGGVDLAALFPQLWETQEPRLQYAQLVVGGEKVGPAVVLQPMVSPVYFYGGQGRPQGRRFGDTYSGLRAYIDMNVVMNTSMGEITFRMRPDQAPNTVFNFLHLADNGYYNDIIFHRIIGERPGRPPFVVQGGDPTGTGTGGPGFFIDLEPSQLPHDFGVLSMARSGEPNSNGSQIFICLSRAATQGLDNSYTSFAQAISGAEVIKNLGSVETGEGDRPVDPPSILTMKLVPAAPYGTGPDAVDAPGTDGP